MSMATNNPELRRSLAVMAIVSVVLTAAGFFYSGFCGCLVLAACAALMLTHLAVELFRYRRVEKLSAQLDALLISGTPLPIADYQEGELSVLANRIQKVTLLLKDSAQAVRDEKRLLAESLADISHQLRTPLTAMNLTQTMLRAPGLTEQRRLELTGQLRSLLTRTEWLVETLLKLSRLDAGTVTLAREQVPVQELIARAADPLAIAMELREQRLIVQCGAECFTGDPIWSGEALGNILKNCMEHTPEGGSITVTASETALFTEILVEDTGPGFDEKEIPHLFERFYRGSNAADGSCGIGLALSRTIICAQNGTVQAGNGEHGAKFIIKYYKQVI